MLRNREQHLLLAAAADRQRDLAHVGGGELREPVLDPWQRMCEIVDPAVRRAVLVAVLDVFALLETGGEARIRRP